MKKLVEPPSWNKYYDWVSHKFEVNKVLVIAIKEEYEHKVIDLGYKKSVLKQIPGFYERGTYQKVDSVIRIEHDVDYEWKNIENYNEKALMVLGIESHWVDHLSYYN